MNRKDPVNGKRPKALALLSGGLDSTLAVNLLLDQGIDVEAVNFMTPFCLCDRCSLNKFVKEAAIKVHRIFLRQEFLDIVVDPPHGYGSGMNPCVDCRILMFRKAGELAEKTGADFIVTGEVLDQRPFSQRRETMLHIEKEARLDGKIVRPLSAKLLPESEPEKKGQVVGDRFLAIKGRRRLPQMRVADKLNMKDYPCPAGGCLLTDPRFAERLREHLEHEKRLTLMDVALLKVGRHFRLNLAKVIVGRNEKENKRLTMIARSNRIPFMEVAGYPGPVALYLGEERPDLVEGAAAITIRYSDAPKAMPAKVTYRSNGRERNIEAKPMTDNTLKRQRI